MIETILTVLFFIGCYGLLACSINAIACTRIPESFKDFLLLMFIPYVVYCLFFDRDKLKDEEMIRLEAEIKRYNKNKE